MVKTTSQTTDLTSWARVRVPVCNGCAVSAGARHLHLPTYRWLNEAALGLPVVAGEALAEVPAGYLTNGQLDDASLKAAYAEFYARTPADFFDGVKAALRVVA